MLAELGYALLPEHLVLGLVLVLMVLEMLRVDSKWARVAFVAATAAALGILLRQALQGYAADVIPGEIVVDPLAVWGRAVLVACALALPLGFPAQTGFKAWMLAASSLLGGMLVLVSAGFASLFLGIELLSLPAFALMVHGAGGTSAGEAAFKYLVLSSVATALLLFGVALGYGLTGSLAIGAWAGLLGDLRPQATAATLLVLSGLFVKAAVFPFHAWAPDAYAGTRTMVAALLASLVKAAVVLAIVRVAATAALPAPAEAVVGTLAIASIVFGNLAALKQTRLRRLIAYSSVAHAGYMVFALLDTTGRRVDDLLWYAGLYALATIAALAAAAALRGDDDDVGRLDGAFSRKPGAALLLAAAMLSLAGVPPFPGFFAKLIVFQSVIASGHLAAAIVAFAGSFLGLAYYVGLVLRLFRARPAPDGTTTSLAAQEEA